MRFSAVWSSGSVARHVTSGRDRSVSVMVPGLSAVVYRASGPIARPAHARSVDLKVATSVTGRPEVRADVRTDSLSQVSFYGRTTGGSWKYLGTDDSAPYRVFPDVSRYRNGTRLEYLAVAGDIAGHRSEDRARTTVAKPAGTSAGIATVHYRRADGAYTDWGLHLWGDALADGVATTGDVPRKPTRTDAFGLVFEIPLADAAPALNFIIHKPSGDAVPSTREPGGDRAFVPAVSREVWITSGDPTIRTTKP